MPVLPEVAGKVIALTYSKNVDFEELSRLLYKDQLIAGHVLKVANSVAYGGATEIVSLQQASARLGSKLLAEITLSVSMRSDVFIVSDFKKLIKQLWDASLSTSIYSKDIAKMVGINAEMIYVIALFHSVGMPLVLQSIAEINLRVNNHLDEKYVLELMEEFHPPFKKFVMEKWELPKIVKSSVINYLNYQNVVEYQRECAVVYLGHQFSTWMYSPEKVSINEISKSKAVEILEISKESIDFLIERKSKILSLVESAQF